jgi:hypothetical protein
VPHYAAPCITPKAGRRKPRTSGLPTSPSHPVTHPVPTLLITTPHRIPLPPQCIIAPCQTPLTSMHPRNLLPFEFFRLLLLLETLSQTYLYSHPAPSEFFLPASDFLRTPLGPSISFGSHSSPSSPPHSYLSSSGFPFWSKLSTLAYVYYPVPLPVFPASICVLPLINVDT